MVADAVTYEPVSTLKFPANREKNREFRRIRPLSAILKADTSKFKGLQRNSLRNRTGNYFGGTGNSGAGTGNFTSQIRNHDRMRFSVPIGSRTSGRCSSAGPGPAAYAAERSTDVGEPHSLPQVGSST